MCCLVLFYGVTYNYDVFYFLDVFSGCQIGILVGHQQYVLHLDQKIKDQK